MKKYIIAALAITSIITIAFGLLMYKIGENYPLHDKMWYWYT